MQAGGLATTDNTVFYSDLLDLLAEDHALDIKLTEYDAVPIKNPKRMPPMLIDRQTADLNIRCAIRPFPHVENTHHLSSAL